MMYVVDTNVISELFKPNPCHNVIWWMQDHNESIYLNAVTLHELHYGIGLLPEGRRKRIYLEKANAIAQECINRILPFDAFSGHLSGTLHAEARQAGRQGSTEDCMIAAICERHGATLATRNVKDFAHYGIKVVNPFEYESETLKMLRAREAQRKAGESDA